ncbi:hypothetical protein [Clostridium botulinum]|uniref:hypothetical protein n=1 Tax=Clostridium botulinum TaxID=1491 RepID=UPI001C9B44AD|nr:hypothetical protein [Clostridium botulinum]MBY6909507.1 hypothetical protein [Clostridium botulinum]
MAESQVNIVVSAITDGAVSALNKVSSTMEKVSKGIDNTSTKMYNFSHTIQEFGQNMYSIGQRATIGISAPLLGLGKKMVETGANMTAMHATYKTVFGNMTSEAQNWSRSLSKSVGLNSGIIDQTTLQFRKMAGAFGLTGKEALDFSSKWTKLTLDVAAFNDIPIDEATDRMMSGLRGEVNAVEKLGIFMGEAQLKTQMLSMGLDGQYSKLSQNQKMTVLYNLAMKQTSQATGQAQRESVSYQNSLANLKQTFSEFAENFYSAVQPALLKFMDTLDEHLQKLKKLTPEQLKFYSNIALWLIVIPPVVMYLGAFVEGLGRLGKVMSFLIKLNFASMFLKVKSALETIYIYALYVGDGLAVVGGWLSSMGSAIAGAFATVAGAVGISVGWLIAIIAGIGIAVFLVVKYWDEIKAWTIKTWGEIVNYLSSLWNNIANAFNDGLALIQPIIQSIVDTFVGIFRDYILPIYQQYIAPVVQTFVLIGQLIWQALQLVGNVIAIVLMSVGAIIVGFAKGVWAGIMIVVDIFKILWQVIVLVANAIGVALSVVGTIFLAVFGVISTIVLAIGKVIEWLVMGIIFPIFQFLGILIYQVVSWFVNILWSAIKFVVDQIVGIIKFWAGVFTWLVDNVINPVIQWIVSGFQRLNNFMRPIVKAMADAWTSFGNGLLAGYKSYIKPAFDWVVNGLKSLNSRWSSIWSGIKNTFLGVVRSIANAWRTVISSFKLPHLKVSGKFSIVPPSTPSFSVDWYAKGGLFNSASVIGVGEAGSEAVLPLTNNRTMSILGSAIAEFMPDVAGDTKDSGGDVVINVHGLVVREEADVEKIGQQLYKLQKRELRRTGRSDL